MKETAKSGVGGGFRKSVFACGNHKCQAIPYAGYSMNHALKYFILMKQKLHCNCRNFACRNK